MLRKSIPRLGRLAPQGEQEPTIPTAPNVVVAPAKVVEVDEVVVVPENKEFGELAQYIVGSMMEYIGAGGGDLPAETFVQGDGFTEQASKERDEFLALLSQATGVDVSLRLKNSEYGSDGVAKSGVLVEPWLKEHLGLVETDHWGKPNQDGVVEVEGGIQRQAVLGTNDENTTFVLTEKEIPAPNNGLVRFMYIHSIALVA